MSEKLSEGLRVNVSPAVRAALEARARSEERSLASVVRRAINSYLNDPHIRAAGWAEKVTRRGKE